MTSRNIPSAKAGFDALHGAGLVCTYILWQPKVYPTHRTSISIKKGNGQVVDWKFGLGSISYKLLRPERFFLQACGSKHGML